MQESLDCTEEDQTGLAWVNSEPQAASFHWVASMFAPTCPPDIRPAAAH